LGGYENVQYLWLSLKKESQEKNNQKESQEEKEIVCIPQACPAQNSRLLPVPAFL